MLNKTSEKTILNSQLKLAYLVRYKGKIFFNEELWEEEMKHRELLTKLTPVSKQEYLSKLIKEGITIANLPKWFEVINS